MDIKGYHSADTADRDQNSGLYRRIFFIMLLLVRIYPSVHAQKTMDELVFYPASHSFIQYTGRVDFTVPALPRFWQPGVYIDIKFSGEVCEIILNDEVLWGKNHNYIEVVLDGKATRMQTKASRDTIRVSGEPSKTLHTLRLVKNTEANIGYLELAGIRCKRLEAPSPRPARKIEFIGNSITCGTGSDASLIPCGKGVWQDQHNAYLSYGAVTARKLDAQYHLSAVSGIGLMHSCCGMDVVMPQVFDKIQMRNDTINWDFKKYQPDVVTVCLGQNDGIQDSTDFTNHYLDFLHRLRAYYPSAAIVCLSSPMADSRLKQFMIRTLNAVVGQMKKSGDKKVFSYFFSKQYYHGCDFHPDLQEHQQIASELTVFIKKIMHW